MSTSRDKKPRNWVKIGTAFETVRLTTCDGEHPPWKIAVKETGSDPGRNGLFQGGRVLLEDIPVLYFPVAVFPVRTGKTDGFLASERGAFR